MYTSIILLFHMIVSQQSIPSQPPIAVFSSCSVTARDAAMHRIQEIEVARGTRSKDELETLDQIAMDNDIGVHVCFFTDPATGKRFVIAFMGTGYQGHAAISIAEEK